MENKKKILIFSTAYLPLIGGAELAVKSITDRIGNFEFDLLAAKIRPGLSNFERIGNVNVYRVGFGGNLDKLLLPFLGMARAWRLNRTRKYSIVWSVMASYGGFAGLFYKILNPKIKFLLTLQEGDDLSYIRKRVGIFYAVFRQIFKRADYIQAISNFLASWAKEMGAKCPIKVVPNGVSIDEVELKVKNNDLKRVISVSRLVEKNGIGDLIKAMTNVDGELWLVGDGGLRPELEKLARELKIESKVKFLGEKRPEEAAELLLQADVFVRPSLSEGLGNAFLEAMAIGVPVIGTPVGGIPDFLKEGETGWLCEPKNPESIAEKIKYVLADENQEKLTAVTKTALKMVAESYNWDKIANDMRNTFNQLS